MNAAATGRAWPGIDVEALVEHQLCHASIDTEKADTATKPLKNHEANNCLGHQADQPSQCSRPDAKETSRTTLTALHHILWPCAQSTVSARQLEAHGHLRRIKSGVRPHADTCGTWPGQLGIVVAHAP